MRLLATLLILFWSAVVAQAAGTATPVAIVVSSCGAAGIFGPPGNSAPLTVDTAGNICGSGGGGGGGGTSSSFGAAFPATGTAAGMSDGTNMVPFFTTDGTSLDVNCVTGCSGGGGGGDVNITEVGGNPVSTTVPVSGTVIIGAGTDVIGHVITDSGSVAEVTNAGTFAVQAAQSGTWNITSITNPVAATQSGTWNIGTLTSITDPVDVAQSGSWTVAATQSGSWNVGQSGAPWSVTGSGTAGTAASGVMTVQGISGMTPVQVNCVTGCSGGGGGGGTSSAFGDPFPTDGTAVGMTDGTDMVPFHTSDGTSLDIAGEVTLGAGSNVIGHIIVDSGSIAASQSGTWNIGTVTSVTNPVAVTQSGSWNVGQSGSPWIVAGGGTAGSAASGVVTVQGIASMTPVQVSQATASNLNAAVVGTGSAGSPASGVVTIQGIPSGSPVASNLTFIGSNAISAGNGTSGTGVQRVTIASDSTGNIATIGTSVTPGTGATNLGKAEDAVAASGDVGVGALAIQQSTPADTAADGDYSYLQMKGGALFVQPIGGTTGGMSNYVLEPAASDNHATIKNGAGTVYHIAVFNNSATVNYLRLYDAGTGFNGCGSATNLAWESNIPASTSGAGFITDMPVGVAFTTGISICVTGGYGQTDTTAATASAISVNIGYK